MSFSSSSSISLICNIQPWYSYPWTTNIKVRRLRHRRSQLLQVPRKTYTDPDSFLRRHVQPGLILDVVFRRSLELINHLANPINPPPAAAPTDNVEAVPSSATTLSQSIMAVDWTERTATLLALLHRNLPRCYSSMLLPRCQRQGRCWWSRQLALKTARPTVFSTKTPTATPNKTASTPLYAAARFAIVTDRSNFRKMDAKWSLNLFALSSKLKTHNCLHMELLLWTSMVPCCSNMQSGGGPTLQNPYVVQ